LKLVLDTNVVISGFLWGGIPYRIMRLAEMGKYRLFSSVPILEELEHTLAYDKFALQLTAANLNPAKARAEYEEIVTIVEPVPFAKIIVKTDPSDDKIIATALSARAEFIISGNSHLLDLRHSYAFRILTPAVFLHTIASAM